MPSKENYRSSEIRRELGLAWCSSCKQNKPQDDFPPDPGRRPFGLASNCYSCDRKRKANSKRNKYQALSPEERKLKNRRNNLRRFGLSLEDYAARLAMQQYVCAICKKPESEVHWATQEIQPLVVDHDAITGKVRGLLCTKCNKAIGLLFHDFNICLEAANYLLCSISIESQAEVVVLG